MALYTLATPTHNVVAFSCVHYTGLKYQRLGLYSRTHLFFITYTPRGRKCAFVFSRQVLPLVAVVCLYCALSQGAEERLAGVGGYYLISHTKQKFEFGGLRVLAMFRYATKLIALKAKRCQVLPLIASGCRVA